jgi:hypothetical protein
MLAALVFAATIAYPFDPATIAREDVRECMERVLKAGGYGHLPLEGAAFLILEGDAFECAMWPRTVAFHAQTWGGRVPDNTAAIIHSHPADLPEPSGGDTTLAKKLGIPVFVVTPRGMTRTPR